MWIKSPLGWLIGFQGDSFHPFTNQRGSVCSDCTNYVRYAECLISCESRLLAYSRQRMLTWLGSAGPWARSFWWAPWGRTTTQGVLHFHCCWLISVGKTRHNQPVCGFLQTQPLPFPFLLCLSILFPIKWALSVRNLYAESMNPLNKSPGVVVAGGVPTHLVYLYNFHPLWLLNFF